MKGLAFAVKALISALALYLAFRLVNVTELQQRFYRLDLAWIVAAQTALVVQIVLAAARWQIIAEWCGAKLTMLQSLRFTLIGAFFSQTLPSTIGGDAARMWFLARAAGHSKPAVYSVLMDRAAGLIWLAVFVLVCLPWSMRLIESPVGRADAGADRRRWRRGPACPVCADAGGTQNSRALARDAPSHRNSGGRMDDTHVPARRRFDQPPSQSLFI